MRNVILSEVKKQSDDILDHNKQKKTRLFESRKAQMEFSI